MFFILYLPTCLTPYFHSSYYWLVVKLSDVCSAKCCQGSVALAEFLFFQYWLLWFSAHHYYKALGIGFCCLQGTLGAAGVIGLWDEWAAPGACKNTFDEVWWASICKCCTDTRGGPVRAPVLLQLQPVCWQMKTAQHILLWTWPRQKHHAWSTLLG